MRKIVTGAFLSLDGVMQAPGGPDEDPTSGFRFGGWTVPFWDDVTSAAMGESFATEFDLLLGRKTYDIFAAHWPHVVTEPGPDASSFSELDADIAKRFNRITKHVATHHPESLRWENSKALGADVVASVRALKNGDGPTLLTQGSSELVHLLLANDLIDELRLLIYPLILGSGKRLFAEGSAPRTLSLAKSIVSPTGVILATYVRATDGNVKTGSFALEAPTDAEIARRRDLT